MSFRSKDIRKGMKKAAFGDDKVGGTLVVPYMALYVKPSVLEKINKKFKGKVL